MIFRCVLFELCTLERAFNGGRRSIIEKISRAEYGPADDAARRVHLVILSEIVPNLLKKDQDMRMGATMIYSK